MAKEKKKQLGQLLIESEKLTSEQVDEALRYKQSHDVYLGKAIIALGFMTDKELAETLSHQLEIPYLDLAGYDIQRETLNLVEEQLARKLMIMPIFSLGKSLTIAISDPLDIHSIDEIGRVTGLEVNTALATEADIENSIDLYYGAEKYRSEAETLKGKDTGVRVASREIGEDTEIIDAVNLLFDEATKINASDIHIEPRENDIRIRFRVDGVLQQYYTLPIQSLSSIITRIKILSDLDIADSRRPQDGRFSYANKDTTVDVRTSIYPTSQGEKVVMRILDTSHGIIDLYKLGFTENALKRWRDIIQVANGIIIVCGPTGSGKTTTLYATLDLINTVEKNIITIEDPIEYRLGNINQGQVNPKAGLTFSEALRSMLRQDPDIIMVGEMRDVPTIELSVRAALTGHLVFSTIHTNDAVSTFTRLMDMGVDNYLISSTIRGILAQRLIRLLCPRCKTKVDMTPELMKSLKLTEKEKDNIFQAKGCMYCKNSGYFGRAGVYELLISDEDVSSLINKSASYAEIKKTAVKNGMSTLKDEAMRYVVSGRSSIDEMYRVSRF